MVVNGGIVKLGTNTSIASTAVIGASGLSVRKRNLFNVPVEHKGGVIIGSFVEIGPLSVVHRATQEGDNTVVGFGTLIGTHVNVGHNVKIGSNCVITSNVVIGGSARIGDNVWIGLGVIIRPHVTICRDVVIGMGSVVVSNIELSGYYMGSPCRWYKMWNGQEKPF